MKILFLILIFLAGCAQVRTGTDIARHYPNQIISPSKNLECQKFAVEKNFQIEYSKWKTDFSGRCYPDPLCKQDFFDCLNSKGYRYQE